MFVKFNSRRMLQDQSRQGGASLIEILISLLMVSIGVLGLVTTQMSSLTNNREAYFRTQATVLAYDIIDRLRANREAAIDGEYVIAEGNSPNSSCASNCSPAQIADSDVSEWKTSLQQQLPGGDGSIVAIAGTDASFAVEVRWDRNNGEETRLDVSVRLL